MTATLRQQIGCWVHERWRTELVLRVPGFPWLDLCNRHESLTKTDSGRARACNWSDTSPLTVCRLFPATGARLLRHCLTQWPIRFAEPPQASFGAPDLSLIIAFRGTARLPQLRCCLASLWGQFGVSLEIILVEQSWDSLLDATQVPGVRLVHARSTSPDMPFNKSWALNVGARLARSDILLFHDADMLAPHGYAQAVLDLIARGFAGARLPRLIFYLDAPSTVSVQTRQSLDHIGFVSDIQSNGRIPLTMTKQAYWDIGGHDESFYGWGGEDDEILQRAETLRLYPGAFLPFIHLWHPSQPEKHAGLTERESFIRQKMEVPPTQRMSSLLQYRPGDLAGPWCRTQSA
ncbi:glycosyltransferase family 2 protein [Thiocapsa roseopersicina]|uniref:N-terminal domain of galactosyltransferase n=1 Tax=Thiocapsa roseopersicina TaxID=1058 RepID=A0A1H2QB13_THIRO|nr:galactosyltransferase-related protein [Thiocapsa roseopersicina]SDW04312.1 N-terminal domain of galactosyltransferase [Thiocapsa roseopersicina]